MLISRLYKPKKNTLLYHYCSVETLSAIAEHKKIRFSDVNMMNDYYETRYAYEIFEEAATSILNDTNLRRRLPKLDKDFLDAVDQIISPSQLTLHPVIACFSKSPDVLSQWRGYADEAKGVAIGFDANLLNKMPISMLEVEYERGKQVAEMKLALAAIYMADADRKEPAGKEFRDDCRVLAAWSLGFKGAAFKEEQEVRLLHVLNVELSSSKLRLVDADDVQDDGTVITGQPVKFRVSDGSLIAYVDIPLPPATDGKLIPELWVGPRNSNSPGNLMYLLGGNEIADVSLKPSRATYR